MTTIARKPSRLGGVDPLPDSLLSIAPEPVREASQALAVALERHCEAIAAAKVAEAEVDAARAEDRAAAREAELQGGKPPKPKAPAAEAKLAEAQRTAAAAQEAAAIRQDEYLAQLRDHLDELHQRADAELAQSTEQAAGHLEAIEGLLIKRGRAHRLKQELGDGGGLAGRAVSFGVAPPRRDRDPLAGTLRETVEALREALGAGN